MSITSITIAIPERSVTGLELRLTTEQARALHAELDRLFGPRPPSLLDRPNPLQPRKWLDKTLYGADDPNRTGQAVAK